MSSTAGRILRSAGLLDPHTLQDRVQDVFLSLCRADFKSFREFRGESAVSLSAWLRTVTAHSVLSWLEKENHVSSIPLEEYAVPPVQAGHDHRQFLFDVERCLQSEKPRDRIIFWLKHRHGYTPQEIAGLPGIRLQRDGVETLLTRLLKSVAACLKKKTATVKDLSTEDRLIKKVSFD